MRVFLVERDYTHLVAGAWGVGVTTVEDDDTIGGRRVMGLVETCGDIHREAMQHNALLQGFREPSALQCPSEA